ncbi:CocE/NonD family hydrolase [Conexibacter stalactiti]|uniref:CocE/NonD family hydrolase n=1 Tax=Conexibacter stalactiti TaxID=1940611 RepID=A0ABU4HQD9_9ACTN|nr:CocE/NonD family hydrolase [Conexibacter stalactiti]MDW5595532.1 CocE/NonD family hydrolase [Conexibacter stalactiti]MEC5036174.1 CocE/NonD family hydrolase [Conexibacter stalactiti]
MLQTETDVLTRRGVGVPMRDGVTLLADLFLPAGDDRPRPVLLQRTPYDRTSTNNALAAPGLEPARAIDRGFAVVVQDVRGCFASAGQFRPFEQEGDDGEDTIAWIAAQPWCDGTVVTWGASYVGATQLLAAVRRPPALRAAMPWMTTDDYWDGWTYRGGALAHGFVVRWLLNALANNELTRLRSSDPQLAEALAEALDPLADDQETALRLTPEAFAERVAPLAPYLRDWLAHPARDDWWKATSIRDRSAAIDVPMLHLGGWFDIFLTGTLANYTRLREQAATAQARAGQRLIVGPWTHAARGEAVGELLLGRNAARAALDTTTLQLDFASAVLRGEQPPGPPVRLFTLGVDRWREEQAWPPARMREQRWFLDGGALGPVPPPDGAGRSAFVHDPADPVPTIAGATMQPGDELCLVSGPRDRRAVQARADVLTFTSAPLERATELTGPLRARLWVASEAPDFDVVATLSWVEPDGRALHLSDGIVRASFRDGPAGGAPPLRAGEPVRLELALDATSIVLAPGTRLRLEVAGACAPRFAPHPALRAPTRIELLHDAGHPSHVVLPLA